MNSGHNLLFREPQRSRATQRGFYDTVSVLADVLAPLNRMSTNIAD